MEKHHQYWSRRNFINTLGIAGAGIFFNPLLSWNVGEADPKVIAIVKRTIGIDAHNHIDVPLDTDEPPGPHLALAGEMKKSGLSAISMTFATDYKRNVAPGEAYQRFLNGLTAMDKVLQANAMKRSLSLPEVKAAHDKHIPTVIQSVEGCHFLEGKLGRLNVAYDRGLRHLGLLHDSDASVPLGDVYTNPPTFNGLTRFGAAVIKECNRLGILIDLAHASNDTINAALKITEHPVLISHTGLNTQIGQNADMAKMMMPRLISKEQAKIVAGADGVIGVWTHLADTPLQYAQNIRAMVDIIGVDHVAIGTDTKLTPPYRGKGDFGFGRQKPNDISKNNKLQSYPDGPPQGPGDGRKGRPGEDANHKRAGERTNEAWAEEKTGFYYAVVDALLKTGFNEEEIGKIGGGNYLNVFNAATS